MNDYELLTSIKTALQGIKQLLESEHAPFLSPVLSRLSTLRDKIDDKAFQLAQNQQALLDELRSSNREMHEQNQLLTEQLKLIRLQNQFLIALASKNAIDLPQGFAEAATPPTPTPDPFL